MYFATKGVRLHAHLFIQASANEFLSGTTFAHINFFNAVVSSRHRYVQKSPSLPISSLQKHCDRLFPLPRELLSLLLFATAP